MADRLLSAWQLEVTSLFLSCAHLYFNDTSLGMPNAIPPAPPDVRKPSPLPAGPTPPLYQGLRSWVRYATAADPVEKFIFLFTLWVTLPEQTQPAPQQLYHQRTAGQRSCRTWSWSVYLWWLLEQREMCRDEISSCKKLILRYGKIFS